MWHPKRQWYLFSLFALVHYTSGTDSTEHIVLNMNAEESTDNPLSHVQSTRKSILPDDCLSICLEYLYKESDLESIRRTSKQYNKMYQQYKAQQSMKFDILRSIIPDDSHRSKYRRIEYLLQNAPLIPGVYVDFQSNHSIAGLHDTELNTVRGLSLQSNLPFLSLRLRDENDREWNGAALLICHFGSDGLAKVNIHWRTWSYLKYQHHKSADQVQHFSLVDLNRVLHGKKSIQMTCRHDKASSIWKLDKTHKNRCGSRISRCARAHPFLVVMSVLLALLIVISIYFVLVFVVAH